MNLDEINDDLAFAKQPYKVIACLAVYGRLPLLEQTIKRLYQKNGCYRVICAGDQPDDKKLCESIGAIWVHHNNKPLGAKWNASFYKAKEYNPDAVLFVGSSDWVSDNWFSVIKPYVDEHGFAGVPGCYLADFGEDIRLVHWKGYAGYRAERAAESIGIGRMLSRRLLEAMDWQPFSPVLDNSLDRSMKDRAKKVGYTDFMVHEYKLKALSISTNLWVNKHKFWMHFDNLPDGRQMIPSEKMVPDRWLEDNFPEALVFHESLKV